ncbi:MAG: biosynthetic-type acetolactate synthase large subunit [Spirochaetes bacterium]|nr:biosynthetic-type acetolactate synthase large subunit [Spirochaetota bacterium]
MNISGAEMIVESLKKEGVNIIFGYPGGAVIPIFDVLFAEPSIHVVLTRHEQGAVHAADGYARSTGRPGVVLVTSGPGATNTITGLATANFDSVPIVCLTGQVPKGMIGNDAFQEADTVGISRPVTKHNYLVTERKDIGRIMKEAFYLATTGRPGPVLIDFPKDIQIKKIDDKYPEKIQIRGYKPVSKGHSGQIKKAVKILKEAKRPLFYIGGGINIADAAGIFNNILEKTDIPVISSLMGIGAVPSDHPRYLGMLGMHGTFAANMAVSSSDLLFTIGARFDDRATGELKKFAQQAKIVHIDIDPAAIARNVTVDIPIVGDAKTVLEELYPLIKKPAIDSWIKQTVQWKNTHPLSTETEGNLLSPPLIVRKISEVFPDAIIATEVGQNQMWAALFYNFRKPRTLLTSGGLGTMGYGFPAAIGAQAGNRDKKVIDIAGDGSIQMNIQELATAVQEELPVIIAILNNGYLGMVRQWQELFFDRHYSSTCLMRRPSCPRDCNSPGDQCPPYVPDFIKLAKAYDAVGYRVTEEKDIEPVLKEAGKSKTRPVIIDFIVSREANVWPMVPAGAGNDEMMLGEGSLI